MGYYPSPQMDQTSRASQVGRKDRLTVVVSILALLVSLGALLSAVGSCYQSRDSNEIADNARVIASSQAALAQREAKGEYTPAFTVTYEPSEKLTNIVEVTTPSEDKFELNKKELQASTTWLNIHLINTGNRPVIILDVGLLYSREGNGIWFRRHEHEIPKYCDNASNDRDIRCYQLPLVIATGGWQMLRWPIWMDGPELLAHKAVNPITIGIQWQNGRSVYETNLVVH
ncbi:hypothetical protein ACIBG0_41945 [Nocardia sp. NPDC050630]|uniref:hypothetical protein n=1 Tax=Nocardia sp. NPDC050630 TaxID=3364321 RepID=UPI00379A9255